MNFSCYAIAILYRNTDLIDQLDEPPGNQDHDGLQEPLLNFASSNDN